jgi:adenosyl cobinamide kinase/adenosyl cobinamide phosphate guanylyltransferase
MILIFGGAFQGKYAYAKEKFSFTDDEVYVCSENEALCLDRRVIRGLERYIAGAVARGEVPMEVIRGEMEKLKDKIIICDDVCCGVVPVSQTQRLYREAVGKTLQLLARASDEVYRVFCGMGEKIQ